MYSIQGRKVEEVADFLDISVAGVYTDKSRCVKLLKEIISNLEEQ